MLSDANVPVRFRAKQQTKYSSLQLTANCTAAITTTRDFVINTPFIQNLNQMASSVDNNHKFSKHILSTPAIFKATSKLFKAAWMTKLDLIFPAFSLRFVDFAVQFCFHCKFLLQEKPFESSLTVAWFFWTNHNSLLRIASNEIGSFCIDNRLCQMAFFVFAKVGKGQLSSNWEKFWNKKSCSSLFLYYIKQIDSMLPCVCSVIDHRGCQNVVRTSMTDSAITWCATFLFLPHFDVICDLLLNRCMATWNLFVKQMHGNMESTC